MKKGLKYIIAAIFILSLAFTVFLFFVGYEFFVNDFLYSYFASTEEDAKLIQKNVTPNLYLLLELSFATISIVLGAACLTINKYYSYLARATWYIFDSLRNVLSNTKNVYALILFIVPFAVLLYYANTIPVQYDEAATYNNFTHSGFYKCLIFYPVPNNHVLNSFVLGFAKFIPFVSLLFAIRIPALLGSLLTWGITYTFVNKYYKEKVALVVMGLLPLLYCSLLYGFLSRGYYLILLFFIIGLYAVYNLTRREGGTKDWFFFTLSSVLGFYTMPSYLYPFLTLNLIILINCYKKSQLLKQLKYNTITVISVILLYSPIILVSGLDRLIGNKYVKPIERSEVLDRLPSFSLQMMEVVSGYSWVLILSLMVVSALLYFRSRQWFELKTLFVWILAPCVLLLLHSVIPFERTFSYYVFIWVLVPSVALAIYINKIPKRWLILLIIFLQVGGVYHFQQIMKSHEESTEVIYAAHQVHELNKWIIEDNHNQAKTVYISSSLHEQHLMFEIYATKSDFGKITIANDTVSADSLTRFDYVILDIDKDATELRTPVLSTTFQRIYTK